MNEFLWRRPIAKLMNKADTKVYILSEIKSFLLSPTCLYFVLGTTFSCVAAFRNGQVEIIPNEQGNRTTPSYVAFTDTERLIGDAAKAQAAMNPSNTVYGTDNVYFRTHQKIQPPLISVRLETSVKTIRDEFCCGLISRRSIK